MSWDARLVGGKYTRLIAGENSIRDKLKLVEGEWVNKVTDVITKIYNCLPSEYGPSRKLRITGNSEVEISPFPSSASTFPRPVNRINSEGGSFESMNDGMVDEEQISSSAEAITYHKRSACDPYPLAAKRRCLAPAVSNSIYPDSNGEYSKFGELATSISDLIQNGQQEYDALVSAPTDVISQNPHLDRPGMSTEHQQTSDIPAETEASNRRNRAPTVDLLVPPSRSDISVPSSTPSQSSGNTTPVTENSNPNPHSASYLRSQAFESELAIDRDQTSEPGRIANADDNGEEAGLHPSKRRRILSSHSRRQSQPPAVDTQSRIASTAPTRVDPYFSNTIAPSSYGLNTQSHTRWSPSYIDEAPVGSRRHLPSNTNFRSVVDNRAIDEGSSHNQSGQIPNPSDVPYGQSAMPQQQVQLFVHSDEQDGSQTRFPVRPSPSSAFTYSSTERNDAQTLSASRPYREGQTDPLQGQHASNLMFGDPGASSQSLGEMGISDDFPADSMATLDLQYNPNDILDPPFDSIQFNLNDILDPPFDSIQYNPNDILDPPFDSIQYNPNDILDPPFDGIQYNPNDILDPPFDGIQYNPNDILDPPFDSIQFNLNDILDPPFDGAQFDLSDNTSHVSPPSGPFEPDRQVSYGLRCSA
ncbi:hypothetical protein BJX99DRAFT_89420 [Aspergillus californicus]